MTTPFIPRARQAEILEYERGWMGISAVPGSGKTTTLSYLAAKIVAGGELSSGQEVLIVTLVNSAVDNFSHRIAGYMREFGLLPHLGYRVRTLHGLAHDIVRERPNLAGISEQFTILDEEESRRILAVISNNWAYENQEWIKARVKSELNAEQERRILRHDWPELVGTIAAAIIGTAKDHGFTPSALRKSLDEQGGDYPLLELGWRAYRDYQDALRFRGALDFDDLISHALEIITSEDEYLGRLQARWPFILEDEAQDSSRLQEAILRVIVGSEGNWVRVGDPNQAIFETFTTASPEYLRSFLEEAGVQKRILPNSGRSTEAIIGLANSLTTWVRSSHPVPELREALTHPLIEPAPVGDPQPNPEPDEGNIALVGMPYSPEEELAKVVGSIKAFIEEHPERTLAALVPRNQRGFELAEALNQRGVPYVEILQNPSEARRLALVFSDLFHHLAHPSDLKFTIPAYSAWRSGIEDGKAAPFEDPVLDILRSTSRPEDLFWPEKEETWQESYAGRHLRGQQLDHLRTFRESMRRWQEAAQLPADQLLLTLAADLLHDPDQLAVAQRFAGFLRQLRTNNPSFTLEDAAIELSSVADNNRRILGASTRDQAFDPDEHPGEVVVSTIHKAKGLEWDRVYLLSVNDYNFPSTAGDETYIAEKWFLQEPRNHIAEALAQFDLLIQGELSEGYQAGEATIRSRTEYAAERLRLLYVALTRARRDLIVTWNTGRRGDSSEALAITALRAAIEEDNA
jgi:DNA helicase-2/ATP-dependent DNA helicase PcrA